MKFLITMLALLALGFADEIDEKLVEEAVNQAKERKTFLEHITLECVKETNLDLGIAKKLLLGDLEHRSDEAKCFVRCLFKREGYLNENDELQVEFIQESLSESTSMKPKRVNKIIKACMKTLPEDPCKAAFKFLECYTMHSHVKKDIHNKAKDEL